MKRFISILFMISLCTISVFAEEDPQEDENVVEVTEDGFVYEQNGAGDQFLKIGLATAIPLNFNGKLYVGGGIELGYYRFLTNTLALGGDIIIDYNVSVGEKSLVTVPITFGGMFQPYYKKFEFPITLGIGFASISCQGMSYFPALTMKASAGAFYRLTEAWSVGLSGSAMWIPQWFSDSSKNYNGFFSNAGIFVRYHF